MPVLFPKTHPVAEKVLIELLRQALSSQFIAGRGTGDEGFWSYR